MNLTRFEDILICPRNGGPLKASGKTLESATDGHVYPATQRIPWLFKDPVRTQQEWRTKFEYQMAQLDRESKNLLAELKIPNLPARTERRLRRMQQALAEQAKSVAKILEPLNSRDTTEIATHIAFKTKLPETQSLMSYYPNLFRDWCWGEEENQQSAMLILDQLANPPDTLLVIGAGGCRLAVDLHQALQGTRTLAVDINPFLFLVARKIINGQKVHLYEFPIAPIDDESFAIKRTLSWPDKLRDDFSMLFADGLNPPIARESVDCIVTPWFVDIVPQDSADFMKRINYLLKPGGRWINFGSLAYRSSLQHTCYSRQEFGELITSNGFELQATKESLLPYLQSPASCQKRQELVFLSTARKTGQQIPVDKDYNYLPEYIADPCIPIPRLQGLVDLALANRMISDILGSIDGKLSQRDLAKIIASKIDTDEAQAEAMVYSLLVRTFEEQARGRQF